MVLFKSKNQQTDNVSFVGNVIAQEGLSVLCCICQALYKQSPRFTTAVMERLVIKIKPLYEFAFLNFGVFSLGFVQYRVF